MPVSPNVEEATTVPIASTSGDLLGTRQTDQGVEFVRVPIADLAAVAEKAENAVQAADLGDAAFLSLAELDARVDAKLGDFEALLAAIRGPQ